jgi:hypothetical protein
MKKTKMMILTVAILAVSAIVAFAGMEQKVTSKPNAVYRWEFESTADRVFARGYTTVDLGRLALQTDTGDIYMLTATTPTWKQVSTGTNVTGTNTGDETGARIGALIVAGTGKTTPIDADTIAISNSAASGILAKLTWANLKATLKTYLDTLYHSLAVPAAAGNIAKINISGQMYDGGSFRSQFTVKELLALAAIEAATAGAIMYHDGSGWAVLPVGSDGQVLKSNGTIPVWGADLVE